MYVIAIDCSADYRSIIEIAVKMYRSCIVYDEKIQGRVRHVAGPVISYDDKLSVRSSTERWLVRGPPPTSSSNRNNGGT